jgi:DNA-binding transcriptional ArsR family regulator
MTAAKLRVARELYDAREHTAAQIAEVLGVSRATLYRHLAPAAPKAEASAGSASRLHRR